MSCFLIVHHIASVVTSVKTVFNRSSLHQPCAFPIAILTVPCLAAAAAAAAAAATAAAAVAATTAAAAAAAAVVVVVVAVAAAAYV